MRLDVTDVAGGIRGLASGEVGGHEGRANARAHRQRVTATSHLSAVTAKCIESASNTGNSKARDSRHDRIGQSRNKTRDTLASAHIFEINYSVWMGCN